MLADILTKEFIWNSYIRYFLLPLQPFLPWIITFAITVFIFNSILDHLYYRLIQSSNPKNLNHKKCRVPCIIYNTRSSDKNHDTFK